MEGEDDSDSDIEIREAAGKTGLNTWPRFLLVEAMNSEEKDPLQNLSPFAVQKWFQGISTKFSKIKKLRNGSFFVECSTKKDSDALRKMDGEKLLDIPIRVNIHKTLNSSRGVIRCSDLKGMSDLEIKDQLFLQGVTQVKRVFITKNTKKEPTNTFFLTFSMTDLPQWIWVGYLRVRVDPFIPTPLRCFKCQHFGHHSKFCRSTEVCRLCGKAKHEGDCPQAAHCVNCEGNHPSSSKECPRFKEEQEIQKIRVKEKCSFSEAKAKIKETPSGRSFASVAAFRPPPRPTQPIGVEVYNANLEKALALLTSSVDSLVNRVLALENILKSSQLPDIPTVQRTAVQAKENTQISVRTGTQKPANPNCNTCAKGDSASKKDSSGATFAPPLQMAPPSQKCAVGDVKSIQRGRSTSRVKNKSNDRSSSRSPLLDSGEKMDL